MWGKASMNCPALESRVAWKSLRNQVSAAAPLAAIAKALPS